MNNSSLEDLEILPWYRWFWNDCNQHWEGGKIKNWQGKIFGARSCHIITLSFKFWEREFLLEFSERKKNWWELLGRTPYLYKLLGVRAYPWILSKYVCVCLFVCPPTNYVTFNFREFGAAASNEYIPMSCICLRQTHAAGHAGIFSWGGMLKTANPSKSTVYSLSYVPSSILSSRPPPKPNSVPSSSTA